MLILQDAGPGLHSDVRHEASGACSLVASIRSQDLLSCLRSVQPHSEDKLLPLITQALLTSLTPWSCSHNQSPFFSRSFLHMCCVRTCTSVTACRAPESQVRSKAQ